MRKDAEIWEIKPDGNRFVVLRRESKEVAIVLQDFESVAEAFGFCRAFGFVRSDWLATHSGSYVATKRH